MKYSKIDSNFFVENRVQFMCKMKVDSIAVFHANDQFPRNGDQFHVYRQNSDLFYLTGIEQEKTILILAPTIDNADFHEILFVEETSEKIEIWNGKKYSKEEASAISGIKTIKYITEFDEILNQLVNQVDAVYVNLNDNPRFSTDVAYKDVRFKDDVKLKFPEHTIAYAGTILNSLRTQKFAVEIELIKHAIGITGTAFNKVLQITKPGLLEYEIEAEIIHQFVKAGANGHAYDPIVAAGKNALCLHYTKNEDYCKNGDLILLDFGAEYANYAADLSRTIPVNGKYTNRQKDCYNAVLDVLNQARALMVVGNTIEKIQREVCVLMEQKMIQLNLFSKHDILKQNPENPLFTQYFMHGVSHFLGLDVHDVGSKQEPLQAGMVLTCEPGLYIKEEGIGIRIENNIVVTEHGPVDLMADIPVVADEIEQLMHQ